MKNGKYRHCVMIFIVPKNIETNPLNQLANATLIVILSIVKQYYPEAALQRCLAWVFSFKF